MNFKLNIIAHTFRNKYLKYTGNNYSSSNSSSSSSITDNKIAKWFYEDEEGNLHSKLNFVGDLNVSAYGVAEEGDTGSITIDVIDNLLSDRTDAALSANLGKVLKELIDSKVSEVAWDDIMDKPSAFPPSTHIHNIADITNLQITLDNKAALNHTHTKSDITDFPSSWAWEDITDKPELLTEENIENWNTQTHTHSNKSVLDTITSAYTSNWNAAYTHISDTTKHITSAERTNWNKAYTNNHTHSNKSVLDTITSTKVNNWDKVYTDFNDVFEIDGDTLKVKLNLVGEKQVSAFGASEGGDTGSTVAVDIIDSLTSTRTDAALSANQGKVLKELIDSKISEVSWEDITDKPTTFTPATHTHNYTSTIKLGTTSYNVSGNTISLPAYPTIPTSWAWSSITGKPTTLSGYGITDGVNAVSITGTGNAITSASVSGHTLTLTKGSTFLLSSAYTAADVLSKLKTVDGSGSGLDADTLDGIEGYNYFQQGGEASTTSDWSSYMYNRAYSSTGTIPSDGPSNVYGYGTLVVFDSGGNSNNGGAITQIYFPHSADYSPQYRTTFARSSSRFHSWMKLARVTDNVASASKLTTTSAGTATRPVYFDNGIPVAGTYTFGNASGNAAISNGTVCANLNADLLDGLDWNDFNLKRIYTINLSSYSTSNFYPIFFTQDYKELDCEIQSPTAAGTADYNCNRIHFLYSTVGWSDYGNSLIILSKNNFDDNEITIGSIGRGTQNGGIAVWVRGGMTYTVRSNRYPSVKTSDYTYNTEKYTVGTNIYGGTNANVSIVWKNDSTRNNNVAAMLNSNVASATKLQTARTIWGQSFDGTANVSGNLTGVSNITLSGNISTTANGSAFYFGSEQHYIGSNANSDLYIWGRSNCHLRLGTNNTERIRITSSGDVGIGTTSPSHKLHIVGTLGVSSTLTAYGAVIPATTSNINLGLANNRWANVYSASGNFSGAVSIGSTLNVSGNITTTANITADGNVVAKTASDLRLKKIIKSKKTYQQRLLQLGKVIDFEYNKTAKERDKNAVDDNKHIGLIYQNAVKSDLTNFCFKDESDGYGSINYLSADYINLIAGALQESIKEIKKLRKEINKLKQAQNEETN